jgi:hypothetical protein
MDDLTTRRKHVTISTAPRTTLKSGTRSAQRVAATLDSSAEAVPPTLPALRIVLGVVFIWFGR